MCGIAGIVDRDAAAPLVVGPLTATLRHRGPDSVGAYERPGVAIGQSRLAVIDLVTGDPPITSEDGAVGVVLNGEIYNYRALQDQVRHDGHELKTECDTEVIAHLGEYLEPVALARSLQGMFAFGLWDDTRRRLVLGRDRFGKKPLYYWHAGSRLVFGSEIKALLADPRVARRLDPDAIADYLTFGYVPTPRSFYDGIQSLPPGHVLTLDAGGGVNIERYWQPPLPGVDGITTIDCGFEEARRETRRLLCDAVDRRMVADVPLGAFLSGGVDSSTVVALMARLSPRPIRTFTIGFDDDQGFDERPYAARVARLYGTDHTEFVVNPDKAELIERLVFHHDQPFGDSSALPTFVLSELTRRHVTVALGGDGGDELFGGYERFAAGRAVDRFERLPDLVRRSAATASSRLPPMLFGGRGGSAARMLTRAELGLPDAYRSWVSYVPEEWRARLTPGGSGSASGDYERVWKASEGASVIDRLLDLNLRTYLLDDLLPKLDRMSMAHGLEVRSPFLDQDLAEFVARLPPSMKILGFSLKRLLKAVARDLLPREILHRRKRGFGVPLDRWFRTDLRGYAESMLASRDTRVREHVDGTALKALLDEHWAGAANHGHAVWTLLTLEVFLRREGW
ncbi:MAG: asparagine synthase (glutamine-hydrolyzing) [Actinobacteria bacterium]|nr:asparagine synthase (glutamine-hydrolyzing) [Actinomycetota bacterium]